MKNNIASRGFRGALLVVSSTLLLGLAACGNTYGPPVQGESLSWGQQHYLDNQRAFLEHDARRSGVSGTNGPSSGHR